MTFHSDAKHSETRENSSNDEATENFWNYKRSKKHSGNNDRRKHTKPTREKTHLNNTNNKKEMTKERARKMIRNLKDDSEQYYEKSREKTPYVRQVKPEKYNKRNYMKENIKRKYAMHMENYDREQYYETGSKSRRKIQYMSQGETKGHNRNYSGESTKWQYQTPIKMIFSPFIGVPSS